MKTKATSLSFPLHVRVNKTESHQCQRWAAEIVSQWARESWGWGRRGDRSPAEQRWGFVQGWVERSRSGGGMRTAGAGKLDLPLCWSLILPCSGRGQEASSPNAMYR